MEVILTQFNRDSADDLLVQGLLASVTGPAQTAATTNRRSSRRQEHKAADENDRAEGEEANPDSEQSDAKENDEGEGSGGQVEDENKDENEDKSQDDENDPEDDPDEQVEEDNAPVDSPPRKRKRGRASKAAQPVATDQTPGTKKATTSTPSTTSRTAKTPVKKHVPQQTATRDRRLGAAATSAKTAAARRRNITGFAEIAEVFFYSLIGIIYVDRPDIGQQLIGLLIIAQDLTRSKGWHFALDYIELVRRKFYDSVGGAAGRHCLEITTAYNMSRRDNDVLFDTQLQHHAAPVSKDTSNPNRGDNIDKKPKSNDTCRGWNRGTCTYKPADCKWVHRCSTCALDHPALQCPKNRNGGAATATAGATGTTPRTSQQ